MNLTINKIFTLFLIFIWSFSQAEEWPMYMKDASRSGKTSSEVVTPLNLQWEYSPMNLPSPAWPNPARIDYWHREANLKPRVIYDRANHTVTFGENLYFGSSSDDKVYCLDVNTGKEKWSFFTGGPVRLAPSVYKDLVYFGSDDGYVYCLDAFNGELKWKFEAASSKRLIPGNERIISVSPVRTGVLIYDDKAYFGAGIFPNEGVTIYSVDALSGKIIWKNSDPGISPQGYMLATENELFIPTGRTTPFVLNRITGRIKGEFEGNGGAYAILTDDALVYGAGDLGTLDYSANRKNKIATFNGNQMLVSGNVSFLRTDNEITAISRSKYIDNYRDWAKITEKKNEIAEHVWDLREQRKVALSKNQDVSGIDKRIDALLSRIENTDVKQKSIEKSGTLWKKEIKDTYSMIIAGNSLITGGDGKVQVISALNGDLKWEGEVDGKVYGLSAANGYLYASTDKGKIYCYNNKQKVNPEKVIQSKENPYAGKDDHKNYQELASKIIDKTGIKKGYCLVIDAGEGQLAYELAKRTELQIIGIENDENKLESARRNIDKTGLYGSRITLLKGSGNSFNFTGNFANLVVWGEGNSSGAAGIPAEEVLRIVKPYGGVAYVGGEDVDIPLLKNWTEKSAQAEWEISDNNKGAWAFFKKGAEPGFGEWTHQYADAGNTSSSMDQLQGPMQIQWFGRPGPRKMINRHSRSVSPLVKEGRLFVPADNRIITVDAYNGTVLWEKKVPGSRVLGALKDFGNRVVTDDIMYIAANNECIGFDVENGKEKVRFNAPQLTDQEHDWGYLSTTGNQLFGTAKKKGATFTILGRINCDEFEGDFREMVTADYLFSLDRHTGKELWTYKNGIVFNNTVTVGNGFIYLIESRNEKAFNDPDGRMRIDHFCDGETYIVKLNSKTGEKEWEKPFDFPFEQIMYLSFSENILLATGSYNVGKNVHYGLFAFDGTTGDKIWTNSYMGQKIGGSHGEQWQHPVIISGIIYNFPYEFDLHTGEKGDIYLTKGGCGGFSGSANNLFARKSNPTIFSLEEGTRNGTPLTRVNRPGCWINIIPASGLISVPESSSGCTCDYPVQTSFVFAPK